MIILLIQIVIVIVMVSESEFAKIEMIEMIEKWTILSQFKSETSSRLKVF